MARPSDTMRLLGIPAPDDVLAEIDTTGLPPSVVAAELVRHCQEILARQARGP